MKTNAKSVQVFEVRLWSKEHFQGKNKKFQPGYDGNITDCKSKDKIFFHTPAQFMAACEKLYKKAEKEVKTKTKNI